MKRKAIGCIIAFILITAISGCKTDYYGGGTNTQPTASVREASVQTNDTDIKKADSFRVGLSLQDDSPFVMRVCSNLEQLIERGDRNIELVVYNGLANATAQIAHVESFISSGFDVIILDPISYDDCALAVTIAQNAGIPLITTVTKTYNPTGYLSFVGSDHFESGVIEANMVADYLHGHGKVVVLEGVMGISAQTERYNGYMSVFKDYPNIEIAAIQTAAWQRDEAYAIVENWIRNGKDFSIVLSENDNMAMGAIEAIEELGKQEDIAVFGIDGDMDALTAVKEGRLKGTVFHNAKEIAQTLYNCIIKLKTYNTVEPAYLIPFEPVTQENVDDYFIKY